ncbi:MAG: NAD(P)-binding domain-containing protein [Elusimicrobiota bacterium]
MGLPRIAIVGMGKVGGTLAYDLAVREAAAELVIIRRTREKAAADAEDLRPALAPGSPVSLRAGVLEDAAGCAVVVLAADARQGPIQSRLELVADNVELMRQIVPRLAKAAPDAMVLVATNPVDVIAWHVLRLGRFDRGQVLSSGTVLDTARLHACLARWVGADARDVEGYVIGEHGDQAIVAWSTVTVAGRPVEAPDRTVVEREVREAGMRIYKAKGGSVYGICGTLSRIVRALASDSEETLTVSTDLNGALGIEDVFLSLPCRVGRGAVKAAPPRLGVEEERMFRESAQRVLSVAESAVGRA